MENLLCELLEVTDTFRCFFRAWPGTHYLMRPNVQGRLWESSPWFGGGRCGCRATQQNPGTSQGSQPWGFLRLPSSGLGFRVQELALHGSHLNSHYAMASSCCCQSSDPLRVGVCWMSGDKWARTLLSLLRNWITNHSSVLALSLSVLCCYGRMPQKVQYQGAGIGRGLSCWIVPWAELQRVKGKTRGKRLNSFLLGNYSRDNHSTLSITVWIYILGQGL